MSYFLCKEPLAPGKRVALTGEEAHHAQSARRLKVGAAVELQDAQGRRFWAVVESREQRRLWLCAQDPVPIPPPPRLQLTLLQAAVKPKAAEWIIQKATELGVAQVLWFPAAQGTVTSGDLTAPRTQDRWERIAWEACKQCDRAAPPQLGVAPGLEAVLEATAAAELGWVLHPGPGQPAAQVLAEYRAGARTDSGSRSDSESGSGSNTGGNAESRTRSTAAAKDPAQRPSRSGLLDLSSLSSNPAADDPAPGEAGSPGISCNPAVPSSPGNPGSSDGPANPAGSAWRPRTARVLIGPEGGLTAAEVARARTVGCLAVSLGQHLLRAETAALVAAALLLHGWE